MTEVQTLTLTDFLLARIAEDEASARGATWADAPRDGRFDIVSDCDCGEDHPYSSYLTVDPARVLAECDAKRRIVRERIEFGTPGNNEGGAIQHYLTLRLLALPYADHPCYDADEWRP